MRIIVVGANGRMGKEVVAAAMSGGDEVVARVDIGGDGLADLPPDVSAADVIIDFSSPAALYDVLDYAALTHTPLVIGTTGHDKAQRKAINKAAKCVPVFYSANMSLGIAVLIGCLERALKVFPDAQVEILERHHCEKADCPSGTAVMIAEKSGYKSVYARKGKRKTGEVGIASLRYGGVFGMHEVIVSCGGQTLTFTHEAHGRKIFAEGALSAARFIIDKRSGIYDICSLIDET